MHLKPIDSHSNVVQTQAAPNFDENSYDHLIKTQDLYPMAAVNPNSRKAQPANQSSHITKKLMQIYKD